MQVAVSNDAPSVLLGRREASRHKLAISFNELDHSQYASTAASFLQGGCHLASPHLPSSSHLPTSFTPAHLLRTHPPSRPALPPAHPGATTS